MSMPPNSNANTYRVGEFVYFDDPNASDAPFQIRKIDELLKSEKGVEARCVVYMRRRDIPQHLLKIADQAQRRFDNYYEVDKKKPENFTTKGFVVANGGDPVKGEELEVDGGDDMPPKIDAEDTAPAARVSEGRNSSSEGAGAAEISQATGENKDENPKDKAEYESTKVIDWGDGGLPLSVENLSEEQRLKLRQHEIFMTRQSEILPATLIRGKCRVVLLGECEDASNYLPHDDTFYHSLVYDPNAQTLLADKGAIRVGEKYQAVVEEWMEPEERELKEKLEAELKEQTIKKEEEERIQKEAEETVDNGVETEKAVAEMKADVKKEQKTIFSDDRDVLVWQPYHGLLDKDIDQYLIIARSVGLFARAIDGASVPKLPTLQLAAAFASRDVTIFHAHAILHQANYDVGQAVKYLVPIASREAYPCQVDDTTGIQTKTLGGPILCRDQLEEWSTPEMNLFEDGLDKCGKDFTEIRADYLPWKSVRDIVEYYYLMKASNRYTERKKAKDLANGPEDKKLSQVYIPAFNKPIAANIGQYNTSQNLVRSEIGCENCGCMDAPNWYQWGGVEKKVLCSICWTKWKKFAGLDKKHELERFDKTRPPVLDQQIANPTGSNGNDRPPVLQVQQQKPGTPGSVQNINQISKTNQAIPQGKPHLTQEGILDAARKALARGQISQEQFNMFSRNFGSLGNQLQQQQQQQQPLPSQHTQQLQQQPQPPQAVAPAAATKRKAVPATKPNIVFYTTICRRAVRRLIPKSAFNLRKISRKPFTVIDDEAILKSIIFLDKKAIMQSAYAVAGEKRNLIIESAFHKGITHLQHTLTQATTGKRSAPQTTTHPGEPSAKIARN